MVRHRISLQTSKFQMRSSSPHPQGYYPWQFQGSSSKSLGRVVWPSKKRTLKILLFYLWWPPRYAPRAKFLLHCILLFITFDLICIMTMFVQNGFWTLWGYSPLALPPGKFQMCSSSLRGGGVGRGGEAYEGPAKSFVTGFGLLQCYHLSNIFLLQTFKVFPLYWNTFL